MMVRVRERTALLVAIAKASTSSARCARSRSSSRPARSASAWDTRPAIAVRCVQVGGSGLHPASP